jgi:hypothetical protein
MGLMVADGMSGYGSNFFNIGVIEMAKKTMKRGSGCSDNRGNSRGVTVVMGRMVADVGT